MDNGNFKRALLLVSSVLSAGVLAGSPVAAQTSASEASADAVGMGEIVVTAQKRSERLSETPLSISAVSGDDLNKLAGTQFRDFANTVPGLAFTTNGVGDTQVSLRGVTTGTNISPTVAIYVDDVPYGSSSAFAGGAQLALDTGLFDLDRIEVLRGPQGTLYGASTMGGLIKYVTRTPDASALGGSFQAGLSNTEHGGWNYNAAAAVNLPITQDIAAVRVSGFYSRDAGFVDNVRLNEENVNRSRVYGGRADLLLKPTERLDIRVSSFLQDIERHGTASVDYARVTGVPTSGELTQSRIFAEPFSQKFRLIAANVQYDFDFATLTSVTSYQHVSSANLFDYTPTFGPALADLVPDIGGVTVPKTFKTGKFTQEARLASASDTSFEWLIGAFYTRESAKQTQALEAYVGPTLVPSTVDVLHVLFDSHFEEIAGFANATYHISPQLDLAGGIRYSHNRQDYTQIGSGLLVESAPKITSSENVATYSVNLRYRPARNFMAYARVASGYRPGGPNERVVLNGQNVAPPQFDADKLTSYEAGIKASTLDRTFSIDLDGFFIDWKNLQVLASNSGFSYQDNASSAHIKGAELTLTARPDRNFTAQGAFGYTDARLHEDAIPLGGRKGDPLPNTPKFTATLMADYVLQDVDFKPTIGGTLRFVSERKAFFDLSTGNPQYQLPSYTSVDLRSGVTVSNIDVQLFVHNLFDSRGQLSAITRLSTQGGPAQVSVLQPRTIGISLSGRF